MLLSPTGFGISAAKAMSAMLQTANKVTKRMINSQSSDGVGGLRSGGALETKRSESIVNKIPPACAESNYRAVRHDGGFWNDHDAFADDIAFAHLVLDAAAVDNLNIASNTAILVQDRALDDRAVAHAEVGNTAALVVGALGVGLETVGADDDRVMNRRIVADPAANANYRAVNPRALLDYAAVADETLV